ncbi:hypothetical protein FSOLCH5_002716 [Fusarium solani]
MENRCHHLKQPPILPSLEFGADLILSQRLPNPPSTELKLVFSVVDLFSRASLTAPIRDQHVRLTQCYAGTMYAAAARLRSSWHHLAPKSQLPWSSRDNGCSVCSEH